MGGGYCVKKGRLSSRTDGLITNLNKKHYYKLLLLSGKTFLGLSVLVKIDLNLLFLRIIGYFRSFLVKISAFYNTYSLKLKTKPHDE